MAVFLGIHKFTTPLTDLEVQNGWGTYKESCAKMGLRPIRVHYNNNVGAFCETEANSADDVKRAHEAVTLPLEDVIEVKTLE